jgi:hypothetical protein
VRQLDSRPSAAHGKRRKRSERENDAYGCDDVPGRKVEEPESAQREHSGEDEPEESVTDV